MTCLFLCRNKFVIVFFKKFRNECFWNSIYANCYLYLSRAMDWFDVTGYADTDEAALARIRAQRVLVIGAESDALFPIHQQRALADLLCELGRDVEFVAMPSIQGHDAFLVDRDRFAPVLRGFFSGGLPLAEKDRFEIKECASGT